jgi:hypothetical protein
MDPFAVIEFDNLKMKTKVCKDGGKNPKWSDVTHK